jgi:serine/threonine protein kinase
MSVRRRDRATGAVLDPAASAATAATAASLFERGRAAVAELRAELAELRREVKGARAHRDKGAALLAAASEAVFTLEEATLGDTPPGADAALVRLAARATAALDAAVALVATHGSVGGFEKLVRRSPASAYADAAAELRAVADAARRLLDGAPLALSPSAERAGSGASALGDSALAPPLADVRGANGSLTLGGRAAPAAAATARRLRRGAHTEAVGALVYAPPAPGDPTPGAAGSAWYHVARVFGADRLEAHDLSSGVEQDLGGAGDSPVTALHLDAAQGVVWTGHRSGGVRAWGASSRAPLAAAARAGTQPITALAADEGGGAWAGARGGAVRRVVLRAAKAGGGAAAAHGRRASSAALAFELVVAGALRLGGAAPDGSEPPLEPEFGMVSDPRAREPAHEGPVTALAAAAGRVWTSGGSAAFVCLREWRQRGDLVNKLDLKGIGAATAMLLITPVVRVALPGGLGGGDAGPGGGPLASVASSSAWGGAGGALGGGGESGAAGEAPQAFQLLTAHANGMCHVWGDVGGAMRPLLRVGDRAPPATGLAVCAPLGLICSAHLDGRLLLRALPHPFGPAALVVTYRERAVSALRPPTGELRAAEAGLSAADGGDVGVVTAAHDGAVAFWPAAELRAAAEEAGVAVAPPGGAREQAPLARLTAADASARAAEMREAAAAAAAESAALAAARRSGAFPGAGAGASGAAAALAAALPGDAARWLIDFSALALVRVVGEGAFGQVYLARWQETDVAVKVMSSLSGGFGLGGGSGAAALEAAKTLEREVSLMTEMRHPSVILFMGVCPDPPCVVTEFCARGSLFDLLAEAAGSGGAGALGRQLGWPRRLGMLLDAAKGMLYLHSHKPPILHRDLKSPNLLVDRHWRCKVTDFNLSRLAGAASAPAAASSVVASNPRWHAPEVIHSAAFSPAADVYAFGLVMWEVATWELPFASMSPFQIILEVAERGGRPPVPARASPALRGGAFPGWERYAELMQRCWAADPEARPGFDAVCAELRELAEALAKGGGGGAGAAAAAAAGATPPRSGATSREDAAPDVAAAVAAAELKAARSPPAGPPRGAAPASPFGARSSSAREPRLEVADSARDAFGAAPTRSRSKSGSGRRSSSLVMRLKSSFSRGSGPAAAAAAAAVAAAVAGEASEAASPAPAKSPSLGPRRAPLPSPFDT